ncbi:MAG: DegV family protein, partial [Acidimicrobiales bacterium]
MVKIVTDSACDIPPALAEVRGISIVPLRIRFGPQELEDRTELSPAEFWRRCAEGTALPQTAAPSPGAFGEAFQQARHDGHDALLCLTISAKLSGTHQSAITAANDASGIEVAVLDTETVTMGQGLVVLAAA